MLFEMPLLLGEGSERREKMEGQFLFEVKMFWVPDSCRPSARE